MAVVTPEERPAAASITQVPKTFAWAAGSLISGYLLTLSSFGWPLLIGGIVKSAYDILLLIKFQKVRPPEEQGGETEAGKGAAPERLSASQRWDKASPSGGHIHRGGSYERRRQYQGPRGLRQSAQSLLQHGGVARRDRAEAVQHDGRGRGYLADPALQRGCPAAGLSTDSRDVAAADRGSRCAALRLSRIQLLDVGRVEERDRLGLAPARSALRRQAMRHHRCGRRHGRQRSRAIRFAPKLRLPRYASAEQARGSDRSGANQIRRRRQSHRRGGARLHPRSDGQPRGVGQAASEEVVIQLSSRAKRSNLAPGLRRPWRLLHRF